MKRAFVLVISMLLIFECTFAALQHYHAVEIGLSTNNSGKENVRMLDTFLDTLSKNAILIFEKGVYHFEFDSKQKWVDVISKTSRNIQFQGHETTFTMDNENPDLDYYLFRINGSTNLNPCEIVFKNITFQGPLNPGSFFEKNKNTLAIYLTGGHVRLYLNDCIIKGNFFSGVVATGDGNQGLTLEDCEIESYGAISAGVFGTGNTKYLHCKRVKFLRSGLPPDSTQANREFGAAIYCHPNVSVKVQHCKFYNNHRNAIQFASGKALKYQKYPSKSFGETQYQLFEHNYFDSTCTDGIQLGFYYPHAIIRNNTFYNRMIAVQGLIGATIESNYFGPTVLKAIEYNLDYSANEDDTIHVAISKNQVHSWHGFIFRTFTKEAKFYDIQSSMNRFTHGGIQLGSAYGGDSCKMVLSSIKDSFFNAGLIVGFDHKAIINEAYVKGNDKFLVIPKEATGSHVSINKLYIDNELNPDKPLATIYAANPVYSDTNAVVVLNHVRMKYPTNMLYVLPCYKNVLLNYSPFELNKPIPCATDLSHTLNTTHNTYKLKGNCTIEYIGFNQGIKNGVYKWSHHVRGLLHLKALDGFFISSTGNIHTEDTLRVPKGKTLTIEWNRSVNKWDIIAVK